MTETSTADFRARLAAVNATTRQLRIAAFVDYAPFVCGIALQPVTLRSYNLLLGWNNAFVSGGAVTAKDIAQFVWLHHPEFGQFAEKSRRRVFRQIDSALRPALPGINALAHIFFPLVAGVAARRRFPVILSPLAFILRRIVRPTAEERYHAAVAEIRRILNESLHDFPISGDEDDPLPYALSPQLVSLMVRGYGLEFETARRLVSELPLKELLEYIREVVHRFSKGKDKLLTAAQARVWEDYLEFKNEAANTSGGPS